MAEAFDPDKYLAEKTGKAPAFDPDKYLAEKLGSSSEPQGELDFSTQAGLGFMSGEDERQRYLEKKVPGAKFGKWKDQDIVVIPGEKSPRYVNQPGLTSKDIASWAGDVPGIAGGLIGSFAGGGVASIPLAAAGGAGGEVTRKAIGRKFLLGEDVYQPDKLGSDLTDVGVSSALAGGGQAIGNVVVGSLARRAGQKAVESIGRGTAQKVLTQAVEGPGVGAIKGPAVGQAVAEPVGGLIKGELGHLSEDTEKAVAKSSKPLESLSDLVTQHEKDAAAGLVLDLPSADRLREIEKILPDMQTRPLDTHYNMLKSKQDFDMQRVRLKQLPGKEREALDAYDQKMKAEIQGKIDAMIGPNPQTKTDVGTRLMSDVNGIYQNNRKAIGPLFEQIQATPIPERQHVEGLLHKLADEVPSFGKAVDMTAYSGETGKVAMRPFSSKMGMSRSAYGEVSQIVDDLNSGSLSFKEMQSMREYLRKQIDPTKPGATADLQGIRKAMLSHMEELVETRNPDVQVRNTFKAWAKNEKMLEDFEGMLGGKMEHIDALYKANPDRVLNNLFADVNTIKTTRDLLGPAKFQQLAGDYLNTLRETATDSAKNQMSMARFASQLKQKRGVIEAAFGKDQYQRLSALADLGKIIPDMPPINPSGTGTTSIMTKTMRLGKDMSGLLTGSTYGKMADGLDARATEKAAVEYFNVLLKQSGEPKPNLASKLLPYAKTRTAQAFLKSMINASGNSLRGANDGGLINPPLQGPGGR